MNAVTIEPWWSKALSGIPSNLCAPGNGLEVVSRAIMKGEMLKIEGRIAISSRPATTDLMQLAAVGAAVAEYGPRGGRWLQRSRAEQLLVTIEDRILGGIGSNTTPRSEDFIKLVLAAAVVTHGKVLLTPDVLSGYYQRATDETNEHVTPGIEPLVQLAITGATWAQSGTQHSLNELIEKRTWMREKVLAYTAPLAQEFIELTVLEVAVQRVQHKDHSVVL